MAAGAPAQRRLKTRGTCFSTCFSKSILAMSKAVVFLIQQYLELYMGLFRSLGNNIEPPVNLAQNQNVTMAMNPS